MRAASTLTAIGTALWFAASSAYALGFGRITNATQLGQPLDFAAAVHLDGDEALPRECVFAEVQSGENKLQPGQVRVTLEGPAASSDRSVRVTTNAMIDEPVVTVSVTLGCMSKITRKFVAFIDPPLINAAQSTPMETLPPQRVDSQVAPIVRMVQGDNAGSATPRASGSSPGASRPRARERVASSAAPTPARNPGIETPPTSDAKPRRPAVTRQSTGRPTVAAGPRLKLEAAAPAVARVASAPAFAPEAAAPLPAAVEPASAPPVRNEVAEQLAKERQRIQLLEEGLAKLRADSQAAQTSIAALQLRLKEAESERYANPLVYALAWLSALLALAVAALWWRQSRARHSAQWWSGAPAQPREARVAEPSVAAPETLAPTPTAANAFDVSAVEPTIAVSPAPVASPAPVVAAVPAPAATQPARELSVEELIDLEQQAEFFIVLGQDEAAIELLMSHVRSDGGISPLPYLKLLEIYRRRGDGEAYERIRDRFNRRFNAYAPDWESDLQHGRSLEDYPDTMTRLQALWSSPVRVMETLDASLFRRNKTDDTFDLPAYRELLFLYSVARDLAEHGGHVQGGTVDLLLPLADDDSEEPISRLMATAPGEFMQSDLMTMPLDLDVSLVPEGAPQDSQTPPAASLRNVDLPFQADSGFVDFDLTAPINPGKLGKKR